MACCGKRTYTDVSAPTLTVNGSALNVAIRQSNLGTLSTAKPSVVTKSNRFVPGTPLFTCASCGTKSVFAVCPFCGFKTQAK